MYNKLSSNDYISTHMFNTVIAERDAALAMCKELRDALRDVTDPSLSIGDFLLAVQNSKSLLPRATALLDKGVG